MPEKIGAGVRFTSDSVLPIHLSSTAVGRKEKKQKAKQELIQIHEQLKTRSFEFSQWTISDDLTPKEAEYDEGIGFWMTPPGYRIVLFVSYNQKYELFEKLFISIYDGFMDSLVESKLWKKLRGNPKEWTALYQLKNRLHDEKAETLGSFHSYKQFFRTSRELKEDLLTLPQLIVQRKIDPFRINTDKQNDSIARELIHSLDKNTVAVKPPPPSAPSSQPLFVSDSGKFRPVLFPSDLNL